MRYDSNLIAASPGKSFANHGFRTPFGVFHGETTILQASVVRNIVTRSFHHRARGYLAGLHSYQPSEEGEAEFESFESAWDAIQSVPDDLLEDFEDELWESQSRRFVYGTKEVSVIDAVETETNDEIQPQKGEKVIRYLVFNERPNLIQTAVEVPRVGAPYEHYHFDENKRMVAQPPSPISQTHLGGLAMALPFWHKANDPKTTTKPFNSPNCLLIGAGGCSLAHTLAANMFLEEYNDIATSDNEEKPQSIARPGLTAVEACPEIMRASILWFGAGTRSDETSKNSKKYGSDPPFFDLVESTGELYLDSLVKSLTAETDTSDSNNTASIDVLIIDAEDGSAPPQSMRSHDFWINLILPSLNHERSPVIGVNSIGTEMETNELALTMQQAFGGDYTILAVAPPPQAMVNDRHKLIFALPQTRMVKSDPATDATYWSLSADELTGHVDAPEAWTQEINDALKKAFEKKDF